MDIKKIDNPLLDSDYNSKKTLTDNNSTFLETFNQVTTKANKDILVKTGIKRLDNLVGETKKNVLKSIDSLNKILDIDILSNTDKFFNDDGKINIHDILDEYGDNVKSKDLIELGKQINYLYDKGMISDADYFYALRWIALKIEQFRVKLQLEDNKSFLSDLMEKPKKSL